MTGGATPAATLFMRRRCRVISGGSPAFESLVRILLSERSEQAEEIENTAASIRNLQDPFEEAFAMAALYENQGKVELMLNTLEQVRLSGHLECCRRLYAGIAREKLGLLEEARQQYQWVLRVAPACDELITAAQFNLEVTVEKENPGEADFGRFISRGSCTLSSGEDLLHKALCMELVLCLRTGRSFRYVDLIESALKAEELSCPAGYVKTLVNWVQYNGEHLTPVQREQVLAISSRMPINTKAALLYHIIKSAESDEARVLRGVLTEHLGRLAAESRSQSVRKFYEELV